MAPGDDRNGARLCKNSADYGPDAILDPLYCRFGNDDLRSGSPLFLMFRFLARRSGFHTASGNLQHS